MVWWLKDWMAWLGWEYNDRALMRKPPWPPDRWAPPPPALLPPNSCLSPVCATNTFKPGTFQKNTAACTSWLNCWYLTILRWYLLQKNGRNCHRSVFCFCCSQISSKLTDISESMRFSSKGFELVSLLVGSPRLSREEEEEGRDYWLETVSIFGCFDTSQQSKASSEGHHMSVCASCYQWPQAQACPRTSPHFAPLRKNPWWAFNPQLSWLLTLFISSVFMSNTKVHDWSIWSCAIVLCYKRPHWHSAGLAPKWNHLFDLKIPVWQCFFLHKQ